MGTTCVNCVVQLVEQGSNPSACKVELRMNCGKLHAKEDHFCLGIPK